ncbi:MAG: sugar ABC transporter ATP-binding protein [Spirochaetales bacterium]|uniref:Ribose/galactose/methyl galactoside import ATP-binding protein n=1 Tax=Candidatus Thalassospirochaeta sargassi TaxID=3119039 RepID=A0AAJ1MND9_9SPIO|nr:sugar ABC transporter ATP-binding protein [Spirochaetales bacterium]
MSSENPYILEMQNISKSFPGVKALKDVSFRLKPGTVHALMGENGAGKSTLMKCLFGIYMKENGEIHLNGEPANFKNSREALEHGVSMIHQELNVVPDQTVMENIWLGREFTRRIGPFHLVNHRKMAEETRQLMKQLEMEIEPEGRMGSISISHQQACEIAKAVSYNASVVVMDEPTSSLSDKEVNHLFKIIRSLREQNVAIIYISHKMSEIFQIADEISVMRDGELITTAPASELDEDKLINLMVGRDMSQRFPIVEAVPGESVMQVKNLTSSDPKSFKNVSFDLRRGEILGIGGLVGAQRTELVESIFGLRATVEGTVSIEGQDAGIQTAKDAIHCGMGLITEDRRGAGIFPQLNIIENTSMPSLDRLTNKVGLLDHKTLIQKSTEMNEKFKTKTPTMETKIRSLSGGNQQKVIVARWMMTLPEILIMDEPTRGIDVGAKYEIYCIMAELAAAGKSIIMVSSEMPELIGMSHRIMVLCDGRKTGELEGEERTQENIMRLAARFGHDDFKEEEAS